MMIKQTIALEPRPVISTRRAAAARLSEKVSRAASATPVTYHPAFGNGDTPHYGL